MATKIRLKKLGKIREPHYRVIVIDERAKRNGREIEVLGQYHPKNDPSIIKIDSERAQHWLSVGAQPTEAVVALLKRTGDWQKFTGDTSIPSGVQEQAAKPNKLDLFNAALAEADGEPTTSAISKKGAKDEAADTKPAKDKADDKPDASADKPAEKSDDSQAKADHARRCVGAFGRGDRHASRRCPGSRQEPATRKDARGQGPSR